MAPALLSPFRRAQALTAALVLLVAAALGSIGGPLRSTAGADTSFTFTGGGWGHGVGMSQHGACGMASQGHRAAAILTHYYRGTAVTAAAESSDLRVLLKVSSTFTLTAGGPTTFNNTWTVGAGQTVTVTRTGSGIRLGGALAATVGGTVIVTRAGSPLRVSPPGHRFNRGTLAIGLDGGGGLRAVLGALSTNAYLRGLGEMPSSWPTEALKAQAIAGRTIARSRATRAGRWSSDHDLNAAVDGAYIGYEKEFGAAGARWNGAVDASAGQIVTYGGAPISAVYSSSSGGMTANSESVWVSPLPYLRATDDPSDAGCGNPNFRWSSTFSGAQLGQKLGMGGVRSITVGGAVGPSGRFDKASFRFTDSRGAARSFTGAQLRSKLGLRSTKFLVGGATYAPRSTGAPAGSLIDIRAHDRRNLLVAGRASDPDGAPRVFVADAHDGRVTWRVAQSVNGYFLDVWPAANGKHTTCVAVLDTPTGAATQLGCRQTVVK